MQYRSALLGCGSRGGRHALGYRNVQSAKLVAAVDMDEQRLGALCDEYDIAGRYTDYETMLREVKPDIVHCVTQPDIRVEPVRIAGAHGVKAIVVEKPMANTLSEAEAIEKISRDTGIKVIVNTQRRYFPSVMGMCELVRSGEAGRIRHIRIASNPSIACNGSHMLDIAEAVIGDVDPQTVWACATGAQDWHTNHPGPTNVLMSAVFPDRISLHGEFAKHAVTEPDNPEGFWMSARIDVITDRGHIHWSDAKGWSYLLEGMSQPKRGPSHYPTDDRACQSVFTEAIATWLNDPSKPHGNRLENAMRVYRIVCAAVQSAARNQVVEYAPDKLEDCSAELRAKLIAIEGDQPDRVDWSSCRDAAV